MFRNKLTPGKKSNLRTYINKELLRQSNNLYNVKQEPLCCNAEKINKLNQGWNDKSQSENMRIAQTITRTLGGKYTINDNINIISYLGGQEGQPGGFPKPLRNKF